MNSFKFRRGVLQVFWPYIRPARWKIGLALAILLLDTLADLASPWPIKLIFDTVLLGKHLHQPWSLIIPRRWPRITSPSLSCSVLRCSSSL